MSYLRCPLLLVVSLNISVFSCHTVAELRSLLDSLRQAPHCPGVGHAGSKLGSVSRGPPSRQLSLKRLLSLNRQRLANLNVLRQG